MTQSLSCADYLKTLSPDQLRCWVRLNLSYDQIANVLHACFGTRIHQEMQGRHLSHSIIRLCDCFDRNKLYSELVKEYGDDYQLLPENNKFVLDLIKQAKDKKLSSLDLSCLSLKTLPDSLFEFTDLETLYLAGNCLTSLPSNISILKNLLSLDLYQNNISFISPKIASLSNLTDLNLSYNKLTSLPDTFTSLSNLITLNLFSNTLTSLPDIFGNLSNLTDLNLSYNQLTSLPSSFVSLSKLTYLNLHNNKLSYLPNNFANLCNLTKLYLSYNQLISFPSDVSNLSNLSVLSLASNNLTSLPTDFGNLSNLTTLSLSSNQLTYLPDTFGNLSNLSYLDLDSNQLTYLPDTFGNLSNLSNLDLRNNQLTSLPDNFGSLSNLTKLYLSDNKLTSLPQSFSSLSNLSWLFLDSNQLTSLPDDFSNLTNLIILRLQGNDLLPIPPEILKLWDEPNKILNYYSELISKQEKKQLNEAKMLVVGEGKVGKTSIVNKLVHNIFNDPEPMTEGVIIKKHWPITLSDSREIKLNVWDFGGQEIMHATHQFFLTKRSLYLLVLDARQDEQQNRLDYWLKTIENFADDAPIIIVCNQIDVKALELDQKTLKAKYPNIKAFVSTSCKQGKGINTLKETISEEISKLKHIDDLLVASWFKVKKYLENLQKKHKDYLEYSEYKRMCKKQRIDSSSQKTLITFLHALGTVLCFHDDPRVNSTYILNPDWVTEGVYKIINNKDLANNKGVLQISTLSQILNSERYPEDKHGFIIEMMRKFELCFDIDDSNKDKLLVPDLLPKTAPELGNWDDSLRFEYHYDLLPSSVISRFIVKTNSLIHQSTYWRYGVVLESEDKQNKALVKADLDAKKIFIFVTGRAETRKDFLSIVRTDLLKIHKTIPKLDVKRKIPLSEDPSITVDYDYLIELLELGEDFIIPPGLKKKIPVKPLLEGVGKEPASTIENNKDDISTTILHMKESILTEINGSVSQNIINQVVTKLSSSQPKQPKQHKPSTQKTKPVIKTKDNSEQLKEKASMTKPIHILHLSDIHLGTVEKGNIYYHQLQLDLTQNLNLDKLDYLIISGDIANKSTKDEYNAAFKLINQIKLNFGLKDKQVIVAPGNHDLNWDLSEEAYQTHIPKRKLPSTLTDAYIPIETGALLRDEEEYKKRFDNFSEFYREVTGKSYPTNYEDQAILHTFTEDKLLVLSLNSAWQIDHHYTDRATINSNALGKALRDITSYKDYLKIAIWHHPVTGQEIMKNTDFLEQLSVAGFEVCLHGHIHEAIEGFHKHDDTKGLFIIGGGTFGAPTKEQVTGIPLQYNLLEVKPNEASVTVNSRKKEKVDGAWMADARWGNKAKDPKAYYTINLKHSFQQNKQYQISSNNASSNQVSPSNNQSASMSNSISRVEENLMKDIFLCHASEDKPNVVRPLSQALIAANISCWLDEAEIHWGDSITKRINEGLANSRFVIVVLSQAFLNKNWPQRELDAMLNIEASTGQVKLLPLLVGSNQVLEKLPLLNDKLYLSWNSDPAPIVQALTQRLKVLQTILPPQ